MLTNNRHSRESGNRVAAVVNHGSDSFILPSLDSRLRGNDGLEGFGIVVPAVGVDRAEKHVPPLDKMTTSPGYGRGRIIGEAHAYPLCQTKLAYCHCEERSDVAIALS